METTVNIDSCRQAMKNFLEPPTPDEEERKIFKEIIWSANSPAPVETGPLPDEFNVCQELSDSQREAVELALR